MVKKMVYMFLLMPLCLLVSCGGVSPLTAQGIGGFGSVKSDSRPEEYMYREMCNFDEEKDSAEGFTTELKKGVLQGVGGRIEPQE